jgi:hypothetical protein
MHRGYRVQTGPCCVSGLKDDCGFEEHAMNQTLHDLPRTGPAATDSGFELRFRSLFNEGRALSFPCDRSGDVYLDGLSDRARANYFYARAVVGREFSVPAVVAH